jgi:deoxyribodipyrimidine photo-lyase
VAATVVWFRRDLRVHDQPALFAAAAAGDRVAPLFVLDDRLLTGRFRSANRLWFLRGTLRCLAAELASRGARLTIVRADPADAVAAFANAMGARRVLASREYTPYGRLRDARVAARLAEAGVAFDVRPGILVQEPEEIASGGGRPFRAFGPFRRSWHARARRDVLPAPGSLRGVAVPTGDRLEELLGPVAPSADPALLSEPGETAARARLTSWANSPALDRYAIDRNRLDLDGTSRLSQDLRFGLLSPVEVAERCEGATEGRRKFLDELAWRDFYAHLLWHEPRVGRESFRPELDDVAWERDAAVIDAWRDGRTGYPVVDAAMRQLRATGWMHNRARMIAASFLTKHLGVDWRVGERHFMEHLVDGDPASNNGGWQWAASTGTDPQPWFRVFNPIRQGLLHDPEGEYVRRWLPELRASRGPATHEPLTGEYLPQIVSHAEARGRALAAYRAAASAKVSMSNLRTVQPHTND